MQRTIWMVVCCVAMASSCLAQTGKPTTNGGVAGVDAPQVELFAGYSYWASHDSVNGIQYKADDQGTTPFAHALVGGAGVTEPNEASTGNESGFFYNPERWGVLFTAGIGVDYATPLLHHQICNSQNLKAVEKFDSRRLHQIIRSLNCPTFIDLFAPTTSVSQDFPSRPGASPSQNGDFEGLCSFFEGLCRGGIGSARGRNAASMRSPRRRGNFLERNRYKTPELVACGRWTV